MTRSTFALLLVSAATAGMFVVPLACTSDDGGGGPVPVSSGCTTCVDTSCQAATECTDSSCQACLQDVTIPACQTGTFAVVAQCACSTCSTSCAGECAAFEQEGKNLAAGGSSAAGGSPAIGAGGGTTIKPTGCGFQWGAEVCQACMDETCCGQQATCAASQACTALLTCLDAGSSAQTCESEFPTGASDYAPLQACLAGPCGSSCGTTGGGGSTVGLAPSAFETAILALDVSESCVTCLESAHSTAPNGGGTPIDCGSIEDQCGGDDDEECGPTLSCVATKVDEGPAEDLSCLAASCVGESGSVAGNNLFVCMGTFCSSECHVDLGVGCNQD